MFSLITTMLWNYGGCFNKHHFQITRATNNAAKNVPGVVCDDSRTRCKIFVDDKTKYGEQTDELPSLHLWVLGMIFLEWKIDVSNFYITLPFLYFNLERQALINLLENTSAIQPYFGLIPSRFYLE